MRRALVVVALVALPGVALASDKPAKVAITPAANEAAVIVRAPTLASDYRIVLSVFDPAESQTKSGPLGGWSGITIRAPRKDEPADTPDGQRYFVKTLKPGTWVVHSLTQQTAWGNCYHAETVQFDVKPGQLLFLGDFDGRTGIAQLQRNALTHGDLVSRNNQFHHYFDGIVPPGFAPVDAAALAGAAAFVKAEMPKTDVTPTAVAFGPARFGTGSTLFGEKVCGGYFKKKVAPAAG